MIIPKKWSIARSSLTEIEVINRSLNSITFRSQHLENFSLFLYYCPSKLECLNKSQWIAVNYFFDVIAGLSIQQRQHSPFNLQKTSISKLRSDNRVHFAAKIMPALLKTRSHAADDSDALLYSLIEENILYIGGWNMCGFLKRNDLVGFWVWVFSLKFLSKKCIFLTTNFPIRPPIDSTNPSLSTSFRGRVSFMIKF